MSSNVQSGVDTTKSSFPREIKWHLEGRETQ